MFVKMFVKSTFGIDDRTYAKLEDACRSMGIDLGNMSEAKRLADLNADKLDDIKAVVAQMKAGLITDDEAIEQVKAMIVIP